ncbi:type I-E CRISPR-associated protein Cas6/Cse3/CasE [Longispora fulva]|uniref:CRISPR system Cascade subunit CasE n=1 Tax=Longispora fulva TaxID=619741 RepID=A0A8J7KWA2_9ACTN|nr:type I-E CRISPR-associated protein Cas6/Cse3/CasE [Longispora fulva]MBG6136307.1 CRISPR system Cascade subunit CasE [Longispora fulva]GIG63184.1 type I-E CRISPR-associated protein Cas6/Cse3/CasE [Longispora fulva]
MPFLSRIRINPLRAASQKLLANPRAIHGAVQGGIADRPTDERVLWRLDSDNPHRPMLFVLSPSRPDWTHIVEQAGWPDADGEHSAIADYTPLLAQLAIGKEFAFRLTASPVQNSSKPTGDSEHRKKTPKELHQRSYRLPQRTAAHQLDWLLQRTTRWGFDIPHARTDPAAPGLALPEQLTPAHDVRIIDRSRHNITKPGSKTAATLTTATFEGFMRVTDPRLLETAMLNGIGPSKAYGCGLLTLAPPAGR